MERPKAAIVTCGGLCPGLNDVVRQLVFTLEEYGVEDIKGVRYGFRGFTEQKGELERPMKARSHLTLVPIRPRRRGERRSLRTLLPGVSLRPSPLGFNPDTPRRLSTPPSDAFQLHPDVRFARVDPRP